MPHGTCERGTESTSSGSRLQTAILFQQTHAHAKRETQKHDCEKKKEKALMLGSLVQK
jgi:hypothetical protein